MITVRRINIGEGTLYKRLRLASLAESPEAFGTTLTEAKARSKESWHEQADCTSEGCDQATFLAFSNGEPIGLAALYWDAQDESLGTLIQVWVDPEHRGSNVAVKLLDEIFTWAKKNEFACISAWVVKTNRQMSRLLTKYGFKITDVFHSFRQGVESRLWIEKVE